MSDKNWDDSRNLRFLPFDPPTRLLARERRYFELQIVAEHFWFIRFARISYGRFIAIHYMYNLSTYVQEPFVIGRRGCTGRDLNEEGVNGR